MEEVVIIDENTIEITRTEENIEIVKKDFLIQEKQELEKRLIEINSKLSLFEE